MDSLTHLVSVESVLHQSPENGGRPDVTDVQETQNLCDEGGHCVLHVDIDRIGIACTIDPCDSSLRGTRPPDAFLCYQFPFFIFHFLFFHKKIELS